MTKLLPVLAILVMACGGDDGGGSEVDGGGGNVVCTLQATATLDLPTKVVTGAGTLACNGTATLMVETCVVWIVDGSPSEIGCHSSTMSGVAELASDFETGCGIVGGREYYAQVNATVNGVAQPEKLSTRVTCP